MSVKSDMWIREMSKKHGMIAPFAEGKKRKGKISYGLSSYGYDMRVADEFRVFAGKPGAAASDPKNHDEALFQTVKGKHCVIPANSFALGRSVEYFRIPRNILTICFGKSTYARCGVIVNVTPFEPEWEGFVTISIVNGSSAPVKIHSNEGIAQVVFLESDEQCETSYADKKGKYQAQKKITSAKVQ